MAHRSYPTPTNVDVNPARAALLGTLPPTYYVVVSSCPMPSTVRARYGRVGLVRVTVGGRAPNAIRHSRTARVLATWDRLFWGTSPRCALERAEEAALCCAERLQDLTNAWANRGSDVY